MAQLEMRLESLARSLAAFRPQRGLSISLFLNLDPRAVPTAKDLSSHVTSVVDDARRRVIELAGDLDHEEVIGARDDLNGAETFFEEELDRSGAAGFALYLSGLDGVRHEARLSTPVRDAAHVGRAFAVVPLLPSLERDRDVILAAVGRERGTVWRARDGWTEFLADRTEEIHGKHDQGGWSQARFQRSIERDALDHLRDVADLLEETIQPGSGTLLVVACVEEQRTTFDELLAPHVQEALIGWTTMEAHAGEHALKRDAERLLAARLRSEREAVLSRWREARGHGGRAAGTWAEAVEAAADGAIEAALVDGRTRDAWLCPACGRGSLEAGSCALDGTQLERESGGALELVARGTLAHAGQARLVDELGETDGVAALLRYPVPAPG
jgi:peptide chain release factor subunit 1